jgi:hypothetical protein
LDKDIIKLYQSDKMNGASTIPWDQQQKNQQNETNTTRTTSYTPLHCPQNNYHNHYNAEKVTVDKG